MRGDDSIIAVHARLTRIALTSKSREGRYSRMASRISGIRKIRPLGCLCSDFWLALVSRHHGTSF